MSSAITPGLEILNTQVREVFSDMENNGLEIRPGNVESDSVIGEYAEVSIVNKATGTKLLFIYAPAADIRPESVSILLENRMGDTFSFSDYLAHVKADLRVRKSISLASYEGSLSERLACVLNAAKTVISQDLGGCVYGSEWISIPIQWGDMK